MVEYLDDEYNCENIKFIWGVKSTDDVLTGNEANLYTMNDLLVYYDKEDDLYSLEIETAYMFGSKEKECDYLQYLLEKFTEFMTVNGYSTDYHRPLFFTKFGIENQTKSIEELYFNFKFYVQGYCKVCGIE